MMEFEIDDFNALKRALGSMAAELFAEEVDRDAVFDSKLAASELVSNALRHGGGRAKLTVQRRGSEIEIRVRDARNSPLPPTSACPDPASEGGRGLFLVDSVAVRRSYSEEEGVIVVVQIRS